MNPKEANKINLIVSCATKSYSGLGVASAAEENMAAISGSITKFDTMSDAILKGSSLLA